jgi:hypothetical protein
VTLGLDAPEFISGELSPSAYEQPVTLGLDAPEFISGELSPSAYDATPATLTSRASAASGPQVSRSGPLAPTTLPLSGSEARIRAIGKVVGEGSTGNGTSTTDAASTYTSR